MRLKMSEDISLVGLRKITPESKMSQIVETVSKHTDSGFLERDLPQQLLQYAWNVVSPRALDGSGRYLSANSAMKTLASDYTTGLIS